MPKKTTNKKELVDDVVVITPNIDEPDEAKIQQKVSTVSTEVESIRVYTAGEYRAAGNYLTETINPLLRELDEAYDDLISDLHKLHKKAIAKKKKYAEPLLEAKRRIGSLMYDYDERERVKREQERLLLEQAQREAAEEEALHLAEEMQKEGYEDKANEILKKISDGDIEPSQSLPEVIHHPVAVEGVQVRRTNDFEIIDVGKIDRRFMVPDEKAIRQLVKSMGERAEKVVGEGSIRVFKKGNIASGTRRG